MDKKEIRKELILKRRSLDKEEKRRLDSGISDLLFETDEFKNAHNILLFASTDEEFNTAYIFEHSKKCKKNVFYPKCVDSLGNMEFYKVDKSTDLCRGMYDILEPCGTLEKYTQQENDIIIVPALSVDKSFQRIGYGKGYYDRFLENFTGISICPIYEFLMVEHLPAYEFDMKIDIIITDKEVIK